MIESKDKATRNLDLTKGITSPQQEKKRVLNNEKRTPLLSWNWKK